MRKPVVRVPGADGSLVAVIELDVTKNRRSKFAALNSRLV